MTSSPIQLLIIDDDPIFRMGLRTALEPFSDLEVIADVESRDAALQVLESRSQININATHQKPIDLIILELGLKIEKNPAISTHPILDFCQYLKTQYPQVPILLLTSIKQSHLLLAAQKIGVDGYCSKGIPVIELVPIIRRVAMGERYWLDSLAALNREPVADIVSRKTGSFFKQIRGFLVQPGLRQIEQAIAEVNQEIEQNLEGLNQQDRIAIINQLILTGKRRELLAARWIASQLLPNTTAPLREDAVTLPPDDFPAVNRLSSQPQNPSSEGALVLNNNSITTQKSTILSSELKSILFDKTVIKLQSELINFTGIPLEIDILKLSKKRELLYILLKQLEILLDELILSEVQPEQLWEKIPNLVQELW